MKKKFRIIAAALALCLSVLYSPAALACGYGTAAATQPAAAVQTISTSQKTEQQVWIPTHGGKKYHSKSSCSGMKDPEKVSLDRKTERFHGLQKVLRLNREGSFRLEGAFLCIIAFYRAPPRRSGPRERAGFHGIPSLRWNKWQSSFYGVGTLIFWNLAR